MPKWVHFLALLLGSLALSGCASILPQSPTATSLPAPTPPPAQTMALPLPPSATPLPEPTPTATVPLVQIGDYTCSAVEAQDFLLELSATLTIIQEAVITADLVEFEDRAQLMEVADGLEFDTAWLAEIEPPRCLEPLVEELRLAAEQYIALFRATAQAEAEAVDETSLGYLRTAPEHLANAQRLFNEAEAAIAAMHESSSED